MTQRFIDWFIRNRALRPSNRIATNTHKPQRHKNANRDGAGTTCIREGLLVGDSFDDDCYFLASCAVLSVVRAAEGSSATVCQLFTRYTMVVCVQVVWVCGVPLESSFAKGPRM